MRRVVVALLIEAACFAGLVIWLDLNGWLGDAGQSAMGVFVGVLGTGFPALYYCCKNRMWEIWRAVLLGSLCGGLCALPFSGGGIHIGFLLLLFMLAGAAFGVVFWLTAIWRNDDLTCPKSFCLPCGTAYRVARSALGRR